MEKEYASQEMMLEQVDTPIADNEVRSLPHKLLNFRQRLVYRPIRRVLLC